MGLYLGDGLLAYFGYPQAHEDDAQRAVLAGLAILEAVSALNARNANDLRPKLAVRIGVHSGPVVVGDSNENRANVFGDVPNIASRVQAEAVPGTVMITAYVHHLVSGLFVVEDAGQRQVKGIERPIRMYRVVQPSGARGRLGAAAERDLTPFVGREDELRLLMGRWERVRDGEGQAALILGEAGMGKSRLLQRFREQISVTPHTWIECGATSLHQKTPFFAIGEMFQQGFRWQREQSEEDRLARLEASLELAGLKLGEAVPIIAALMNLRVPDKYPPLSMAPDQQRRRLLATISAWARGTARAQPLVIAIEDLHWADPSTLEAIQLLAEQCATAPLLLMCTARPEFRAPWPMRAHHATIALNRMSARDLRKMVEKLSASESMTSDTVDALIDRSGGVPLFVEELTKTVIETGNAKMASHEIPATLSDLLMARLDRLVEAREVAQIASVIGSQFSWELLSAVAPVDEGALAAALKKLADSELLLERGVPPEATYSFRHALIEDAAYQSLLRSKRQQHHRRIAEVLEQRFPETVDNQPQLLAHHYAEAGSTELAIPYLETAGKNAAQRSANVEAIGHLTSALELLKTQPETPERFQRELGLQLALGTPLIATKGFASPEAGTVYARARELCQMAGEVPQLFPVLWGLWVFYTAKAEHVTARRLADQCLSIAESAGDPAMILEGHHALGVTLTALAESAPAMEHLEHVIAHYDPARDSSMAFGQDPKIVCLSQAAWTLWIQGYPEKALQRNDEAVMLARKLSHPYSLAASLNFGAMVYQLCQDTDATQQEAMAAIALSRDQEFAYWMPWGLILQGWALTQRGFAEEGIAQIHEGVAGFRATGAEVMVPYFLGLLGDASRRAGKIPEGLSAVVDALAVIGRTGECWWEAELYRLKGELTLNPVHRSTHEQQKDAAELFRRALDTASRQAAKSLELRAAMSLSRLWKSQGKTDLARQVLADTYSWFTEGFETADLKEARALLEGMGA